MCLTTLKVHSCLFTIKRIGFLENVFTNKTFLLNSFNSFIEFIEEDGKKQTMCLPVLNYH